MTLQRDIQNLIQIQRIFCSRSLINFVRESWHVVEPKTPFIDGWVVEALCTYLEATVRGDIHNLIINVPPRHMKSRLVNVFFPAWVWTFAPEKKFLFISHSEAKATDDSEDCRKLITSDWYQQRWPEVILARDNNQKMSYKNNFTGYRLAYGLGGGITGQGGDFICVDDPLKASESNSELERNKVNSIFSGTISTRLNNPKTGVKIIIMQRLHEDDLTGYLLRGKEHYEHLVLPAEYEGERFISTIGFVDPRKEVGELLWPERFDADAIQSLKNELMTELNISGQLQQRPAPISGHIYKKEWFAHRTLNTDIIARFISWDTAASVSDTSAFSSCTVGELMPDYRLYIREVYRDKLEFPQLQDMIEKMAHKYKYNLKKIIIESKSSGISVLQTLKQSSEPWLSSLLIAFLPTVDKNTRAYNASVWCENGSVLLPPHDGSSPWLYDFEDELFTFPNSLFKDQVDSFNQLIIYLSNYLSTGYKARNNMENIYDIQF
jgi:predicted phage terminase large subunit-like protein